MIATLTRSGAERVDGDAGDERGVDAAGESEDDVPEAVLLDVVAQPQHERGVHLGLAAQQGRHAGLGVPGPSPRAARAGPSVSTFGCARAAPRGAGGRRADGPRPAREDRSRRPGAPRSNWAARATTSPSWSTTMRVAVEDQLVLAADERAEGHGGQRVARALGDHPLALARPCRRGRATRRCWRSRWLRRAPRRRRRARAPRCPRRSSRRRAGRRARRSRRPRPTGSSAARRTRRSWAGRPCCRSPARRRRPEPRPR